MERDNLATTSPRLPMQTYGQPAEVGKEQRRYPLFFMHVSRPLVLSLTIAATGIAASWIVSLWYVRTGHAASPSGPLGFTFGIIATATFVLAAGYWAQKRSKRRVIGRLNALVQWHTCFAAVALALAALHSFGLRAQPSGTLALYSLGALVISGGIGRLLDHILPRLIAREVSLALTETGEDIGAAAAHQEEKGFWWPRSMLRTIIRGELTAMHHEQNYQRAIRWWRITHVLVAILTTIIVCWHIIYGIHVMLTR